MDIGTAKPDKKQMDAVPHHLIDLINPVEEFNVARYVELANKAIENIISCDKMPIVSGGSALYIYALIDGIFEQKNYSKRIRQDLLSWIKGKSPAEVYDYLKKCDPVAAKKIHPHNLRRIIRALEVYHLEGKPISDVRRYRKGLKDRFEVIKFCLFMPRDIIYKRVDQRVDDMFRKGLVDEVKGLLECGLGITASQAVGYKEIIPVLKENAYSLDEARRLIKRNTRHLVKKQLTWFRKDKGLNWIDVLNKDGREVAEIIFKKLQ
jgi:tRNA dimethylallyltransferase